MPNELQLSHIGNPTPRISLENAVFAALVTKKYVQNTFAVYVKCHYVQLHVLKVFIVILIMWEIILNKIHENYFPHYTLHTGSTKAEGTYFPHNFFFI